MVLNLINLLVADYWKHRFFDSKSMITILTCQLSLFKKNFESATSLFKGKCPIG